MQRVMYFLPADREVSVLSEMPVAEHFGADIAEFCIKTQPSFELSSGFAQH